MDRQDQDEPQKEAAQDTLDYVYDMLLQMAKMAEEAGDESLSVALNFLVANHDCKDAPRSEANLQ